jgi:hypothetical protein
VQYTCCCVLCLYCVLWFQTSLFIICLVHHAIMYIKTISVFLHNCMTIYCHKFSSCLHSIQPQLQQFFQTFNAPA